MKYDPTPVQKEFHALSCDEALFGGSAGSGKSLVLLMDILPQVMVEHNRCKTGELKWGRSTGVAIHFRRELPRLEETIARAKAVYYDIDPSAPGWNENSHTFTFSSGYKAKFAHMKDSDSYLNYRSSQFTYLAFDEVIEFEENQYLEMVSRVRSTDPVLIKMLKVRAATNPAPGWVRKYFIEPAPNGRTLLSKKIDLDDGSSTERTRIFIPARLSDNPNPEYRRQYEANLKDKPPHIVQSLLYGDWFVVAGAFFANEWCQEKHVIKPFKIPREWKRFRSGDWGYKSPCVILWWAVSPENEMICYRERTFREKTAMEVAERIKIIEEDAGEWDTRKNCSKLTGPMDTQLWENRGNSGPTMASDMASVGVYWSKADKTSRARNAQNLMSRLKRRGQYERPAVMFFDTCKGCITTIPALSTDKADLEVPEKGGQDHWYDACSYACSSCILPVEESESFLDDDEDEVEQDELSLRRRLGQYGYGGS